MQPPIDKILDSVQSSIICLDQNLKIRYLNLTAEMLLGNSAASLLGKLFTLLFSPREPSTLILKLRDFVTEPNAMTEHEATLTLHSGRAMVADYSISTLECDFDENLILVEIRPLERQMQIAREEHHQQQMQASQQLARGLAHEIRNPLGGIRGAAQLLEMDSTDLVSKEYTDVIISEVDRLQALVNSMLGPGSPMSRETVNIFEILEHICKLLEVAEPDRFDIVRDYDPSIPEFQADRNQLIRAFLNIAQNAVQSLGEQGEIIFRTRIDQQVTIGQTRHPLVVQVDIIDNGKGISDELYETIFMPMVTDKVEGSGLGLPFAQEIVSRHGGLIRSQRKPAGTVFSTILPLVQA